MRVYIVQPLFIEVSFKILRMGPSLKVVYIERGRERKRTPWKGVFNL